MITNLHGFVLRNKPHIKEYKKARNIHGQLVDDMMRYFESGKFKHEIISKKKKFVDL